MKMKSSIDSASGGLVNRLLSFPLGEKKDLFQTWTTDLGADDEAKKRQKEKPIVAEAFAV